MTRNQAEIWADREMVRIELFTIHMMDGHEGFQEELAKLYKAHQQRDAEIYRHLKMHSMFKSGPWYDLFWLNWPNSYI